MHDDGERHEALRGVRAAMMAIRYARIALGLAFLSAVASRFGWWGGGSWSGFVKYTGQVCSFMPRSTIPLLAVAATCCELSFGIALVVGIQVRAAAIGAAILL